MEPQDAQAPTVLDIPEVEIVDDEDGTWAEMTEAERAELVASLIQGMKDIDEGRGIPLEEVRTRLRAKHGF